VDEEPKKTQLKRIVPDPELVSETSESSDIFRVDHNRRDTETPVLNQLHQNVSNLANISAPNSTNSSICGLSMMSSDVRWTPYQDRTVSATKTDADCDNPTVANQDEENDAVQSSPTSSQLAKKRLGFEGLFDQTDPQVNDIDDVIGLCSGKFITQPTETENFSVPQEKESHVSKNVESQDTMILDHSRPPSSLETQDTVILTNSVKDNPVDISVQGQVAKILEELPPNEDAEFEIDESDDEDGVKISKKRKRRLVSDSEESDDDEINKSVRNIVNNLEENSRTGDKSEDEVPNNLGEVEYDSDENPIPKDSFKKKLFDKKGKLKKDFFEAEAELSGSEEGSDDEDERGMDRLEMEEGDLDEIDMDEERDKVGRIHQKQILDEDQANLKLFQDRFLEDGDLHTDYKRQRQFKWAGLDDVIESKVSTEGEVSIHEDVEKENEEYEKWRLAKLEREKWIKEKMNEENQIENEEEKDSQFFKLADRTLERMSSKEEDLEESSVTVKEKVFKSPLAKASPLQSLQPGGLKGSFLARGDECLGRLAQFNKVKDDVTGARAKAGRNFVFATISPSKKEAENEDCDVETKSERRGGKKPPAKKAKICRTLDEQAKAGTIFNLL